MNRSYPVLRLTCPETGRTVYCEWVGSCDAPGQSFLTEAEVVAYWMEEARRNRDRNASMGGPEAIKEADINYAHERAAIARRWDRLHKRGHTYLDRDQSGEDFAEFNRAGKNGGNRRLKGLVDDLIKAAQS